MDIARRLFDTAGNEVFSALQLGVNKWGSYCESPIETLFLSAITLATELSSWSSAEPFTYLVCPPGASPPAGDVQPMLTICPQFKWQSYRIDFALWWQGIANGAMFIECDGHDFHERTPAQAERDRSKDRAIQEAGFAVLRFTGREINRDPFGCAYQVLKFASSRV
jgi:hypothetical protein